MEREHDEVQERGSQVETFAVVRPEGEQDGPSHVPEMASSGMSLPVGVAPPDSGPPPNPFDPARLRLRRQPGEALGIRRRTTTVPVRKPDKEWWVRTHPDREAFWLDTNCVELRQDGGLYLVDPALWEALATEPTFGPRTLALAVERGGAPFLWPIRPPDPTGRRDAWNESAAEAAVLAQSSWVRVVADLALGAYRVYEAAGIPDAPAWPDEPLHEVLRAAFRGRYLEDYDDPVLRKLRGEV